jgi:hypothetical protein
MVWLIVDTASEYYLVARPSILYVDQNMGSKIRVYFNMMVYPPELLI